MPKRILAAATTVALGASALLARGVDATADEQAPATPGQHMIAAAAGPDIAPVSPPPAPAPALAPAPDHGSVWNRLADCESGDWDRTGTPVPGTARWDLRPGAHIFEGGLQFHPDTWDAFAPRVLDAAPVAAYQASRTEQIAVGEAVLDAQGWGAWPACSRKLGLAG